ncbi:hypothetical protein [Paenibacillus sp. LjRoot56]
MSDTADNDNVKDTMNAGDIMLELEDEHHSSLMPLNQERTR